MMKTSSIIAALALVLTGCGSEEGETGYTVPSSAATNAGIPEPVGPVQDDRGFKNVNNAVVDDTVVEERLDDAGDGQATGTAIAETEEDAGRLELAEDTTAGEDIAPDSVDDIFASSDVNDDGGETDTARIEGDSKDTEEEAVLDASAESVDISLLSLNGEYVPDGLPAPLFIAENHDGGTRTEADLVGKPTILWFFPFAGTPG